MASSTLIEAFPLVPVSTLSAMCSISDRLTAVFFLMIHVRSKRVKLLTAAKAQQSVRS